MTSRLFLLLALDHFQYAKTECKWSKTGAGWRRPGNEAIFYSIAIAHDVLLLFIITFFSYCSEMSTRMFTWWLHGTYKSAHEWICWAIWMNGFPELYYKCCTLGIEDVSMCYEWDHLCVYWEVWMMQCMQLDVYWEWGMCSMNDVVHAARCVLGMRYV